MANVTGWAAGRLFSGESWNAAFNAADLNSLPNGSSVLSSVAPFANGASLDQLMDVSLKLTIASSAIGANASIAIWIALLQEDGATLGDGLLAAGSQTASFTPAWTPIAPIPLYASTRTLLIGSEYGIAIPPGTFALILQNNSGFALAASGNACSIRTYNQSLNN